MKKYEVKGHVPSFLPEGSEWELVWNDEFDGPELDKTKWDFRLNFWGKPFDAYTDEGIVFDGNSNIELHRVLKDGRYVSPQLQTGSNSFDIPGGTQDNPWGQTYFWPLGELPEPKFMHRFGYYECRCKFQKEPEIMWSAFWTQSPSIGAAYDPKWCGVESDIMEHFGKGRATTGNIMGGFGIRSNVVLPGTIKTERWVKMGDTRIVDGTLTPIGDISDFEDIANAAWYLGSNESKNVTGSELILDGGMCCQLYPQLLNELKKSSKNI